MRTLHPNGLPIARPAYIPGQEYEFATVEAIDARIAHIEWLFSPSRFFPYAGPGAADLRVELDMLRFQWRGNALVRERQAAGDIAPRCPCVWCNP